MVEMNYWENFHNNLGKGVFLIQRNRGQSVATVTENQDA